MAISRFQLSAVNGRSVEMPLDLGGFGISRFALDYFLYEKALSLGVEVRTNTTVEDVVFANDAFTVSLGKHGTLTAPLVMAAYGKRTKLDKALNRPFMEARSPYIGVKHHVQTDFPDDLIALHNFEGGYCGISQVEEGRYNLCYLGSRAVLRRCGSVAAMEEQVLCRNPHLRHIFEEGQQLFEKPLVINEISFAPKVPVENHMLMVGDSAGLITPLCGNGMAMAIHGAKLATDAVLAHYTSNSGQLNRVAMEQQYTRQWRHTFARPPMDGPPGATAVWQLPGLPFCRGAWP